MIKEFVSNILNSATKIVLLILTLALCLLTGLGIVSEDSFIPIVSMVFGSYFKGTTTNANNDLSNTRKDV